MVTPESLGSLVRRYRRYAELTQEALAERAGLSVRVIRAIEAGSKHRPRPDTLQLLIGALAIPEAEQGAFLRAARELGRTKDESGSVTPTGAGPDLPGDPTPFIGREDEIEAVVGLLDREPVRLVTLTGPGGAGKTRLAVEVARRLAGRFPEGIVFVNLAPLASADLVAPTIVAALHLPKSMAPPLDRLIARLRDARFLLVLDNFEHLLDSATLVSDLLAACPRLHVLATSREALRLRPEYEYPVPPMALPPQPNRPRRPEPAEIERYDSIAFFVDRAGAARPDFALSTENAGAVAAICRRLDGIPLALELAAARLRTFAPEKLLERLDRRLAILTDGPRDLPTRQQTLRAAIDWSYLLLQPSEQTLFARLSVFAGGCTLEAAEAVCDIDGDLAVFADLTSLVEKSLLRWEGPGRFTMLETLRECAGERLRERPERERIREQHAAWVAALIGEEEPPQAQRLAWYRTLDAEVDNLRAALEWTRESGHSEEGMRMLLTTSRYWVMRGWVTERHQRLLAMLALPGESDRHMRARALALAGGTAGDSGRAMLEEGLALSRQLSDAGLEVECLFALAYLATADRDLDRAEELVRTSLRLAQKLGDTFRVALGFDHLGLIAARRGDLLRAVTMEEQSLRLMLEIGDAHQATRLLSNLANYAFRCGDLRRARASLLDALSHADPAGYEGAPAYIVETAAGVAVAGGATELGAKLLGAALTARIKIAWEPDEEERIAVEMAAELGAAAIGTVAWEQAVETGRSLTPRACAALIREMCQDECEAWAEPAGERPAGVDWERA